MDNASAYGAEDCRFDPCLDREIFLSILKLTAPFFPTFYSPNLLRLFLSKFYIEYMLIL